MLARAYDQVYYEGREMGNLPLRGKKTADQSAAVYRAEYAQIVHRFSTLTRIDCEKFIRPLPTSLVHPEMVFPGKKYEAYCLKASESGPVVQYEPTSDYKMDGLQPRVDLRPGIEIPVYPEDEVDADPWFNEYPPYEEFVEGPRAEVEPKRGRSSGAEPSWDVSKVGSRQPDKARSPSKSEAATPSPKLKSTVKSVRLNLPKPEDLEGLGPAARSRYNNSTQDDQP